MALLISFITGYLLGSLPTAYLLLKKRNGIDITKTGSGNVGALNSFEISKSKTVGLTVLVIDLLKGFLSVMIVRLFISDLFMHQMISLCAAVLAHSFSPWIGFKGGRGLAAAAGGALALSIPILIIWAALWSLTMLIKRNVHVANFSATLLTILCSIALPSQMNNFTFPHAQNNFEFAFLVSLMLIIILTKHIDPMTKLIRESMKIPRS